LEALGVNQKPRSSVAHINPDKLNDYFISISSGAAVAAQFDTAGSGYEFDAVHVVDVLYAMNGIKSKAVGDNGISIEFLKMIFEFVAGPITHLVDLSIGQRKFSNSWSGIVVPIPKKYVVLSLGDLRPISLLSMVSKIVEKVIFRQFTIYHVCSLIRNSRDSGRVTAAPLLFLR
jgi:hypothetical protein